MDSFYRRDFDHEHMPPDYLAIIGLVLSDHDLSIQLQSSRKPTGPKTEASEYEVGPVKTDNQEVRLAFGFYQTLYTLGGL
jgi:hypothetical protein